ncbi:MAG: PEP-CTERM sorting domain-containing protein [Verrucomicrobiota bacterium]
MKTRLQRQRTGCRRWLWLALAVMLAVAARRANAQSTIVYGQFPLTPPPPPGMTIFPEDSQGWQVFGTYTSPAGYNWLINGQPAFTFTAGNGVSIYPASSLNGVIGIAADQFGGNNAVPLVAGQEIGPDAAGYQWFTSPTFGSLLTATFDGGPEGPLYEGYFTGLESGYLGLEFQQNGQTYYGWVRVGTPYAGLEAVWLYDYAYETVPNTPIFAGEGEVPEPGTFALLLVSGAAFWLVRKRL